MSERRAFYRKIGYAVAMVILLFPLFWLSSPATVTSQGGKLAQLREENDLSQADLGEIDPASETIKLATLGLRGVAVNLLWGKANEFKKKEDWTNLMAVLEQLSKLQPNFIAFWKFQAWNVSYNVSVEFDDFRDRYYYVRRGIEFLKEGIRYNESSRQIPQLLWDVGWFVGQKIGKADEHVQYRELFRNDDDYHGTRPRAERDNWLRAEEWYDRAIRAVKQEFRDMGRKSQIVFFQSPASARINYSEAIQEEGTHGTPAGLAWQRAHERFMEFGDEAIEHSTGVVLRLNDFEKVQAEADTYREELEELAPGLREEIEAERLADLSLEERMAIDTPEVQRTPQQYTLAMDANAKLTVTPRQLAERIAEQKPEIAEQARELALRVEKLQTLANNIRGYRQTANYDYWRARTEFEQKSDALDARRKTYLAAEAYDDGDLLQARRLYEEGFAHWRTILNEYPSMVENSVMGDELLDQVKAYREVLDQLGETIPVGFPLWNIIEEYGRSDFSQELAAREVAGGADATPAEGGDDADGSNEDGSELAPADAGEVASAGDAQAPADATLNDGEDASADATDQEGEQSGGSEP